MIEQATIKDIPQVQRLIGVGVNEGYLLPRSKEEIEKVVRQGHFYIAYNAMGIVGCAALEACTPTGLPEVRSLVVMPFFRGDGIGSSLIARCAQESETLGFQGVLAMTFWL